MIFTTLPILLAVSTVVLGFELALNCPDVAPRGLFAINDTELHQKFQKYTAPKKSLIHQNITKLATDANGIIALGILDTHFVNFQWNLLYQQTNSGPSEQQYKKTITVGTTDTDSSDTTLSAGVSLGYEGTGVNFGAEHKTFNGEELSNTQTQEYTINVAPQETTYFYQRQYMYNTQAWVLIKNGSTNAVLHISTFNLVGKDGAVFMAQVKSQTESLDFATRTAPLTGKGVLKDLKAVDAKYKLKKLPGVRSDQIGGLLGAAQAFLNQFS